MRLYLCNISIKALQVDKNEVGNETSLSAHHSRPDFNNVHLEKIRKSAFMEVMYIFGPESECAFREGVHVVTSDYSLLYSACNTAHSDRDLVRVREDMKQCGNNNIQEIQLFKYWREEKGKSESKLESLWVESQKLKQHIIVNNSENIIKFLGITEGSGNSIMMVLQYANSGTLRNYLRNKIHENIFIISWAEIILITEQIVSGLQNLYDNNIIHRDLQPKNILIVRDDKNKFNKAAIADFGSASKSDDSMASLYGRPFTIAIDSAYDDSLIAIYGKYFTIEYADPQLINSRGPTFKSDIYSLGIMLWELTSGIRPYSKYLNKLALSYYILNGLQEK
ncbi:kinase-like domain-containing protein [Gigaspora rosea]|uniref:non-specific serine/threonine protein kinase n=1 Tax=Gigaspora rosea TaxID=44941 RepID=A0A397U7Y0_9GLOM|nr:kinase-like domain-containing protein [Gigaspora rosea]